MGSWYEGASGFLYWDMTDWDLSNPWGPNITYGKTGDGVLIYPGNHTGLLAPTGSPSNISIDGPIPSYRLQMIREGFQDWALFKLAEQYGLTAYARSQVAQAYGQLGACSWSGCTPVNGQFLWLSDATLMAQIRHNIAQAIMNSIAGGTPTVTATNTPVMPTVTNTSVPASTNTATATAGSTSTTTTAPTVTNTPMATAGGPTSTSVPVGTSTAAPGTTGTPAATAPPTAASATATTTPASGNLLSNPSFETWAGGLPVAWLVNGKPAPAIKKIGTTPQSGRAAAQVSAHGPGAGLYQDLSLPAPLPANVTLSGRAYVRYVSGNTTRAPAIMFVLRYADGSQARLSRAVAGWPGHHSWLPVTLTVSAGNVPLAGVSFRLVTTTGNAQTVQVDNASVTTSTTHQTGHRHKGIFRVRERPQAGERLGSGYLAEAIISRTLPGKDG